MADPESIVICSGAAQAFALLARTLASSRMAVEDPGLPAHRRILEAHGAELVALALDEDGARVEELSAMDRAGGRVGSALADAGTPGSDRRGALLGTPLGAARPGPERGRGS